MAGEAKFYKTVFFDFFMTLIWATIASTTGFLVDLLSFVHDDDDRLEIAIVLGIIAVQIITFGLLAEALGGASFNPLANISNFAGGVGNETLLSLLLRIPAQTAGMQLGAWLTWHYLVPHTHHHTLEGPGLKPGVDLMEGAIAEFALVFLLNTLVLYLFFATKASSGVKAVILVPSTLAAIVAGTAFTGPAMNPLFAFSWAYHHNRHTSFDHLLVYWVAPVSGAVLAGIVFRLFLKPKAITMEALQKKTE